MQKPVCYALWIAFVFGVPAAADYAFGPFPTSSDTDWAVDRIETTAQSVYSTMSEADARHWIDYVKSHSRFNTKQAGALIADVLKYPNITTGSMQSRLDMAIATVEMLDKAAAEHRSRNS